MKIGIFTYGTRGDVQPYIALALGLMQNGHDVILAAPENFKELVEGFDVSFHPLYGDAEKIMNLPEGQKVLKTENTIQLMKYFFNVLDSFKIPLRESYINGINKIDYIIANSATMPIVHAIAEKQNKKMALTYFMPPMATTSEFPVGDFDFLNFPLYNRLTYKIAHSFYWKFVKKQTNEFREELGLPSLKENIIHHIAKQKILDLYCFSQTLIPQPNDWAPQHKITGFIRVPKDKRTNHPFDQLSVELSTWLQQENKPIYIGFGSNGVGNPAKFISIINDLLSQTNERILFCTGWSNFEDLPTHKNLFVTKYVNHDFIFPQCKLGIFHGGAGTLATMLCHNLPLIIISFYTDQPTWGKIVERKNLGIHIPLKKLTSSRLIRAVSLVQSEDIKENIQLIGNEIRNENGLQNLINVLEEYF